MCSIVFEYTVPETAEIIKERTLSAILISFKLHRSYHLFRKCLQNFITLQCLTLKSRRHRKPPPDLHEQPALMD